MAASIEKSLFSLSLLVSCVFLSLAEIDKPHNRKVKSEFPCLNGPNGTLNVVYTEARGKNDTLHYIISSIGIPTVLVAKTHLNASRPEIDCSKVVSADPKGAIKFDHPTYVFGLLLNRILEYNDVDDEADLTKVSNNASFWKKRKLSTLSWSDFNSTSDLENNAVMFQVKSNSSHFNFAENGSLSFQLKIFGTEGRTDRLPHLAYTQNSAQFDFVLDHVIVAFENSRFALEMALVTSDKYSSTMDIVTSKSIDDEHTPGVFKLYDWVSNKRNESLGSYVQWKPVCYTKEKRAITSITQTKNYDITNNVSKEDLGNSLAYMYFGDDMYSSHVALTMTNVSFGLTQDKFYNLTRYSVWSGGVGYGKPPEDTISTTLIIIILCGLGIPAGLIIFGGIAVCVKKRNDRRKGYQDLSENEAAVNT